jgi:general secretion pathway protein E
MREILFADSMGFEYDGVLVSHPLRVILLVVWFYVCVRLTRDWSRSTLFPKRGHSALIFGSLFAAPIILFVLYIIELFRQAESRNWGFAATVKNFFKGDILKKHGQIRGFRGRGSIVLLDSAGLDFQEVYGSEGKDSKRVTKTISLAEKIIADALAERASDILIDPVADDIFAVRYRVDGKLRLASEIAADECIAVVNSIKALSGMDISEKRRAQDGAFTARLDWGTASFRVASAGVIHGEKLSIRILNNAAGFIRLEQVGLSRKNIHLIRDALARQSGMILMCGPTGSGKTTSLYAMLSSIDASARNIITIEDPVEYSLPLVSQIEVNKRAEITFANTLRNILRQDPDVICVGEIRDAETAAMALQASHTGHMVLATLHSNDNLSAILRLIELGIKPMLISEGLSLIISQRLVRRLCDNCKKPAQLSPRKRQWFLDHNLPTEGVMEAAGCKKCRDTGYDGRVAIFDVLKMNEDIRKTLFSGPINSIEECRELGSGIIKSRLRKEALKAVVSGLTSLDEIKSVL